MNWISWLVEHWFTLVQTVGVVGGLLFTGISLRMDTRVRRAQTLIQITEHHREIWSRVFDHPELIRILSPEVDLERSPVTEAERNFVLQLVNHLAAVHNAAETGIVLEPEQARTDVGEFFRLPIPRSVWKSMRRFQNKRFAKFVEESTPDLR